MCGDGAVCLGVGSAMSDFSSPRIEEVVDETPLPPRFLQRRVNKGGQFLGDCVRGHGVLQDQSQFGASIVVLHGEEESHLAV